MRLKKYTSIFVCAALTLALAGCFNVQKPIKSRSEALQKLLKICNEELKLAPVVKPFKNTLYIYLPIEHDILSFKAKNEGPQKSNASENKLQLKFVNTYTKGRSFHVEYDAAENYSYTEDPGYTSAYTEGFTKKQNGILAAVYRSFGDLTVVPGNREFVDHVRDLKRKELVKAHIKTDTPPDFVILVVSNINKGIEVKQFYHFNDYKRLMSGSLSSEEYQRRAIYKVEGHKDILDDKKGKHLLFKDLTWLEFLSMQMESRIKIKYNRSAFPPSNKTDAEMVKLCYETISAYNFVDFDSIELENLYNGNNFIFSSEEFLSIGPNSQKLIEE